MKRNKLRILTLAVVLIAAVVLLFRFSGTQDEPSETPSPVKTVSGKTQKAVKESPVAQNKKKVSLKEHREALVEDAIKGREAPMARYGVVVPEKPRKVPSSLKGDKKAYWKVCEDLRLSMAIIRAKAGEDMLKYRHLMKTHRFELEQLRRKQNEIYSRIRKQQQ